MQVENTHDIRFEFSLKSKKQKILCTKNRITLTVIQLKRTKNWKKNSQLARK